MQKLPAAKQVGFTIAELLIVIIVISILATISIVSYTGVQERAARSSADSAITQVSRKLEGYKINNDDYPSQLTDVKVDNNDGIDYDYATADGQYCLSATVRGESRSVLSSNTTPSSGDCKRALVKWSLSSSGMAYDHKNNMLVASASQTGSASSPKVENTGNSAKITAEIYATQPSPSKTPNSGNYFGSAYFAADKVTPVNNTAGYTGNGHAACTVPLNQWTTCTWTTATGPNVKWVQFIVRSSPANYTSDNKYRNIQITAN